MEGLGRFRLAWSEDAAGELGRAGDGAWARDGGVPAEGGRLIGGVGEELAGFFVEAGCPVEEFVGGDAEVEEGAFDRSGSCLGVTADGGGLWGAGTGDLGRGGHQARGLVAVCFVLGGEFGDPGGGFDAGDAGVAVGGEEVFAVSYRGALVAGFGFGRWGEDAAGAGGGGDAGVVGCGEGGQGGAGLVDGGERLGEGVGVGGELAGWAVGVAWS
jgi:hypothetical protein